jgi:propionate CoA-transferase
MVNPLMNSLPNSQDGRTMRRNKVVTAAQAVSVVKKGDMIATGGFVGIGFAEHLAIALEERFLASGEPADLGLIYAAGQGDGKTRGLNHFGHPGMVGKVIGGHWGLVPNLQKQAIENKIIAYNLPQGIISTMFRDTAAKKPRTISRVGLGTYVDPRNGGGKINTITTEDLVELMIIDGEEYLAYKTIPVDVAFIRGTTADPAGNITMEKEALTIEVLAIAMAARNSGGTVIVQVERIADYASLNAHNVKIPGIFVDYVVVSEPENHWQTFGERYNPSFSSEIRVPVESIPPMEMGPRKIIARRAAFELKTDDIVNLGIGMPEGVSNVVNEEGVLDRIVLTAEPGVIGGIPVGGLSFGAAINTEALIDQPYQFDFYDGGGLDIAFLGMAEADGKGNVNVSKFGPKLAGAGGFINISQNAKTVVFVGTFTAGGLETIVEDGKIRIIKEGKARKFVKDEVEHVTFSGEYSARRQQKAIYITERCVLTLTGEGMVLVEIAPGIDLYKDILEQMDFQPIIREPLGIMDSRIFYSERMGLRLSDCTE